MSQLTALPKGSLILVTGANGYIGAKVTDTLLQLGYRVRGTVRSDKPWLKEQFSKYGDGAFEQVVLPKLVDEEALSLAMTGAAGVAFVASDMSLSDDPQAVIPWVVQATEIGLATAAKHPSIKRVVLTSSAFAATVPQPGLTGVVVTEETWNEPAIKAAWDPNTPAELKPGAVYSASKAEGERAAWKWVKENKPGFEFSTVLPNFNTGEILNPQIAGSTMKFASDLLQGKPATLYAFMPQPYVDVGDVARLHAVALLAEPVKSKRIFAAARAVNVSDFIDVLRELRPENKLIPEKKPDDGRDLSEVPPAGEAEKMLQTYFGQQGWTPFKESVAAGIQGL
ncbi:NAD dependent epimerase/dehydratase [Colletotrichum plurivorum]|uniref:NAD dependent epimerase/dehydratase n=1 Tax=Colletotrichum plurivorum TaxID=2175906 RepID=A0A8H6KT65_9PEZI|nr:NAD dependent epimerase/dehydratase [Colletotrichum plurivorum]